MQTNIIFLRMANLQINKQTKSKAMNIQSINSDIKQLEKCLGIIEKTENYLHFKKADLIFSICAQINVLRDNQKIEFQKAIIKQTKIF